MTLAHNERINIGYDGLNSSSDINDDIKDYEQDIKEWFSENESECEITLHHEHCKEVGSCLYYLDVKMDVELSSQFRNYFL